MEEVRALRGVLLSPAGLVASKAEDFHISFDTSEFEFAESLLDVVKNCRPEDWDNDQQEMMVIRYVVEMCNWSDISDHFRALEIFTDIMSRVACDDRLLPHDLEATLRVFTPDVVQEIQDGATDHNLVRTLLDEYNIRILQGFALYGLKIIPDNILFDIYIEDAPTYRPRAVMIATPIIDIIAHSGNWVPLNSMRGVIECLKEVLERMPERGFLSKRIEVGTGKFQYVLHSILFEIIMNYSNDDEGYRLHESIAEVLDLIFHKTPRLREDIGSVQNKTSDHFFEKANGRYRYGTRLYDPAKWHALTIEDIVALKYDMLRPIVTNPTIKNAFDE